MTRIEYYKLLACWFISWGAPAFALFMVAWAACAAT